MNKSIALYLWDNGMQPIPVTNKIPLIKWGDYHNERSTREEIEKWFTQFQYADVGLVTGKASGLLALDIDGAAGRDSIKGKDIPRTWTNCTKNDGKHYLFQLPPSLEGTPTTLAGLLPSVDIRGQGGYIVVAAPGYGWEPNLAPWEAPLAECPPWLVDAIRQRAAPVTDSGAALSDNWLTRLLAGVGDGERHAALVKLSSYYLSRMPSDVAAMLLRDWNEKNNPPIDEEELEEQIEDIVGRFNSGQYQSKFVEEAGPPEGMSASSIMQKYSNTIDWLVQGLIPKGSSTVFSGWQGRGKSWLVTDLATEIAKGGGKWFGHLDVAAGRVLYVDNENAGQLLSKRLSSMIPAKSIDASKLELEFFVRARIKLTNPIHLQRLADKIADYKPTLVVIDSFASCHTLNENDSGAMRHFFDDIISPLIDEFKCAFLFIDHEGKGLPGVELHGSKRVRGSSAKMDAADVGLSLNSKDGVLVLEHTKARWASALKPMAVAIEDVANGVEVTFRGTM